MPIEFTEDWQATRHLCPRCDGERFIDIDGYRVGSDTIEAMLVECPECGGEGYVYG